MISSMISIAVDTIIIMLNTDEISITKKERIKVVMEQIHIRIAFKVVMEQIHIRIALKVNLLSSIIVDP